jgi:uncharacterized repeat protein (TIGR01451 family)
MNRNRRLGGYLLAVLVLFGVALVAPRAWATSSQTRLGQTVPTATPVPVWSPQPPPTDVPPTDQPPAEDTATPEPPPDNSTATPQPPRAALALVKAANRLEAWPGATVWFTLTVSNPGGGSAQQLVLEDALPAELDPGVVQGTSAAWNGRTLSGRLPVLPSGSEWVITFGAIVREDAAAGKVVMNSARVSAAGGLNARSEAYLALPPAELPTVGGVADEPRLP